MVSKHTTNRLGTRGGNRRPGITDIPSLLVYTPITGTSSFVEDIAPIATNYSHTIRRLGGFWTATWKLALADIGSTMYDEWRSNRFFYHFVEQVGGMSTWEGSIEDIRVNDETGVIDCAAYGYVHSIQNKHNTTTDASTTDADVWMEYMRANYCEFIPTGELTANAVQCYKAGEDKIWDEMIKVVELGSGTASLSAAPWALGVYQDRRLYYGPVSATPLGYVRGGVMYRVDGPNDLINMVFVRYTDIAGAAAADIGHQNAESLARYGRREARITRSNMDATSADALVYAYLNEHSWPTPRAVGCGRDIQVYDSIGSNKARSPWLVQPGVFQDTTIISPAQFYNYWLADNSLFLVDEVVATAKGVQLRTSKWTETDALDAYYDYLADAPKPPDE